MNHIIEIKQMLARLDHIPAALAAQAKDVEKNSDDIAEVRTTLKTIWAVVCAIPIIAGALAFFGYVPIGTADRGSIHE